MGEGLSTEELHTLWHTVLNGPGISLQISIAERLCRQQEEREKPAPLWESDTETHNYVNEITKSYTADKNNLTLH